MALNQEQMESLASQLWDARAQGKPCDPPIAVFPGITVEAAYQVSKIVHARRLKETGARPIGKKIGLTSRAVQTQLGVGEPDFGYLTSDMLIPHGGKLKPGSLIQGRVEGEVAFVLEKELKGPGVTEQDVIAATGYVVACIEIIDSRVKDWKIKIQDTVCDNASSAYFVMGDVKRKLDAGLDLRMAGMTLRKNGEVESTGVGAACLDHPVQAVRWLANRMGELGEALRAGDIILSGAYGPVVPFQPGDQCEVEISGLGKVVCAYDR
jgi:2-oxopent-4-enoate/cis-2-oxohex-4-enoate hydratase